MRTGPIVALFLRVPLGSRSSHPGGTIKNLPILPPCEELLPPTTPKDSSEAPFEAVLARDGFFYALNFPLTISPASALPPGGLRTAASENFDSASACGSILKKAEALARPAAPRVLGKASRAQRLKTSRATA